MAKRTRYRITGRPPKADSLKRMHMNLESDLVQEMDERYLDLGYPSRTAYLEDLVRAELGIEKKGPGRKTTPRPKMSKEDLDKVVELARVLTPLNDDLNRIARELNASAHRKRGIGEGIEVFLARNIINKIDLLMSRFR